MTTDYCMIICFIMIGTNLIIIYGKLKSIDKLYTSWREHTLHLEKLINDLYARQRDDVKNLGRAFKRIQELEYRLEAHAAELTEHHNKIDKLEINGQCYEGLFEQQGLWGESKETVENLDNLEKIPEFPDPEDEGIVI